MYLPSLISNPGLTFFFQLEKLRLREGKSTARGHSAVTRGKFPKHYDPEAGQSRSIG